MDQKNFKEGLPPREQLGELGKLLGNMISALERWENLRSNWEQQMVTHKVHADWRSFDICRARVDIYNQCIQDAKRIIKAGLVAIEEKNPIDPWERSS